MSGFQGGFNYGPGRNGPEGQRVPLWPRAVGAAVGMLAGGFAAEELHTAIPQVVSLIGGGAVGGYFAGWGIYKLFR